MEEYGKILRTVKTRSVSGAKGGILTRYFKEGKYYYVEALPTGTKDKLGFDWGVYNQLYKPPTKTGRLAKTGRLKVTD